MATISIVGSTPESPNISGENGTGTYSASANGGLAVITAIDTLVELTVVKTNSGDDLLPGAEFTATEVLGNGTSSIPHVVTGATDENGVVVLSGLIAGKTYVLSETKAPAGYELLTDTLQFVVQSDGTIDAGLFPPVGFTIGGTGDSVSVVNNPLEVTLLKQAPNGAPLAGAEFTVEGTFPDGSTSKTFTSDENGIVFHQMQLVGSAEGTAYIVTETKAPDGYEVPEGSMTLVVFQDGTVQVLGTSDLSQNVTVAENNGVAVVTVNNQPLPGTELPQTSDLFMPLLAGALGLLVLWAIAFGGYALKRRGKKGDAE